MRPHPSGPEAAPWSADVVVVGGGIIGCAAAAIMADRGVRVVLVERHAIGAGASGRNLGAVQHPFDPVLGALYRESLDRYRALAESSGGAFVIGAVPAGLLLLHRDVDAATEQLARFRHQVPELAPQLVAPDDLVTLEPALSPGRAAILLATGYPIPPASATEAWADLAERNRAELVVGTAARIAASGGRVEGVTLKDGSRIVADAVLVAAGPWTPELVDPDGTWRPIHPTYGVTVQLRPRPRGPSTSRSCSPPRPAAPRGASPRRPASKPTRSTSFSASGPDPDGCLPRRPSASRPTPSSSTKPRWSTSSSLPISCDNSTRRPR